jgi:hypothetical protein
MSKSVTFCEPLLDHLLVQENLPVAIGIWVNYVRIYM